MFGIFRKRNSIAAIFRVATSIINSVIPPSSFYASGSKSRRAKYPPMPPVAPSEPPAVHDTPFAKKTNSFIPFSSSHRVTDELQRQMVDNFEGRFVGPIKIDDFLKLFMPTPTAGSCPKADFSQVTKHAEIAEPPMYDPFVRELMFCISYFDIEDHQFDSGSSL